MVSEQQVWLGVMAAGVIALLAISGFNPIDLIDTTDDDSMYSTADKKHPLAKDCLGGHTADMIHYHAAVIIRVNGEFVPIPEDVGRPDGECPMRQLHTHSENNVVHIELKQAADVPIEAFFDVWGKHFDETGFDDYRVNETHEIIMIVNGEPNEEFNKYILKDDDEVFIDFKPRD
jgi:sulfur carrier protein ThiS